MFSSPTIPLLRARKLPKCWTNWASNTNTPTTARKPGRGCKPSPRTPSRSASRCEEVNLILVDAEMPEMDGYVLTKNIKNDPRFEGVPVVMHSSLSSEANRAMGKSVGVDGYVAKFDAEVLADTLRPLIEH